MLKKIITVGMLCFALFLQACAGTLIKREQVYKPHSQQLDWGIVAIDSIFLLFLVVPGILALAIDYSTGTLYLPKKYITLQDTSAENIQKVLAQNGIQIKLEKIKVAENAYKVKHNLA